MPKWIPLLFIALCFGRLAAQEDLPKPVEPGKSAEPVESFPKPKTHVVDDGRAFSNDPARLAIVENRLAALEQKWKFPIYLVVYDTLIGSDAGERSQLLQDKWIGREPGCVAVLETDTGRAAMGIHPVRHVELEPGAEIPDAQPLELTLLQQAAVIRLLQEESVRAKDPRAKIEAAANAISGEVGRILEARVAPVSTEGRLRIVIVIVGLIAGAGLVALLAMVFIRRADARASHRFVFPDVNVGMRLGAPFGGGKMSSLSFSRRGLPQPEPDPAPASAPEQKVEPEPPATPAS